VPKILLVEDNEMNRGFEVIVALDGAEGIAVAKSEAPALILMDISLPVVNGWDATRHLKQAPETKSIPVIALTAHAMAGDREKCIEVGCDDFDTKPVEISRLLGKIQAILEKQATP
jgi:CheY-like chemotaxis protein